MGAVETLNRDDGARAQRFDAVIDSARDAIDFQFKVAERLDAKSRNQVTVGGAWYALVQAAASIAIRERLDSGETDVLFAVMIVLAIVSGAGLAVSIIFSYGVWKLRKEEATDDASLARMGRAASDGSSDFFASHLDHYRFILAKRVTNNVARARSFKWSVPFWILSLVVGLGELCVALAVLAKS